MGYRAGVEEYPMSTILLTTDLSAESKRAFQPAKELAQKLGLKLRLVAVLEDLPFEPTGGGLMAVYPDRSLIHRDWDRELQKLADELGRDVCPTAEVVDAVDVAGTIVAEAKKCGAKYVAMATHGRSGLKRLLLGSVAELVVRHSNVPVVVYPPVG